MANGTSGSSFLVQSANVTDWLLLSSGEEMQQGVLQGAPLCCRINESTKGKHPMTNLSATSNQWEVLFLRQTWHNEYRVSDRLGFSCLLDATWAAWRQIAEDRETECNTFDSIRIWDCCNDRLVAMWDWCVDDIDAPFDWHQTR
jgi:hypothetical protein